MLSQFWQQPSHLIALKTKSREFTYGELQKAVGTWLDYLEQQPLESGRNGFLFQDPFYTDSCILAHIFSGKTFVPFHSNWSAPVQKEIISKLNIVEVFNDRKAKEILDTTSEFKKESKSFPKSGLMSLFMTSGSTGISKAVGVEYENFATLMKVLFSEYPLAPEARVAQCFLPSFDPYYAVMLLTYSQGARLCFLSREDHFQLPLFCRENGIEFFASTPTLAELNLDREEGVCSTIKKTLFTGEKLNTETVKKWQKFAPQTEIENLYGPVETTVWVTRFKLNLNHPLPLKIPIGKPWAGTQLSLIDNCLAIRGPQVTKGYWQDGKWILFHGKFQTKDRVELNADGDYVFLGREESLLKISGERLDLEDIEQEIYNRFQIFCLLVWSEKNHGLNLVVGSEDDVVLLEKYLETYLPPRFRIKSLQRLEKWPMTDTGKRDRKEICRIVEERL